jgi:hypothetical protein
MSESRKAIILKILEMAFESSLKQTKGLLPAIESVKSLKFSTLGDVAAKIRETAMKI